MHKRFPLLFLLAAALTALSACGGQDADGDEIRQPSDLTGRRITTIAGSIYDLHFSGSNDVKLVTYKNSADCIEALKTGKVDVFIYDETALSASDLERQSLKLAYKSTKAFPVALAFREENKQMARNFNLFLSEIKASGTLDKIVGFWLDDSVTSREGIPEIVNEGSGEPLRYGTGASTAPISYKTGDNWEGLEIELAQRFGAWLGRPVEISYTDLGSLIVNLQSGLVDMIGASLLVTDERAREVCFSDPCYYIRPAFFVNAESSSARTPFFKRIKESIHYNLVVDKRWKLISDGLYETVKITFLSIIFGSLLGLLLCAMALCRRKWMRKFVDFYSWFMRGIPMLVLLMIMFYVVLSGLGLKADRIAVVAFSLNFASPACSVFKNGILSVPRSQTEAGLALGFTPWGTFRHFVLPRAMRTSAPPFRGECVSLLKGTSIVGFISIMDLTRASDLIRSRTFDALLPLIIITVIYFLLAWLIGILIDLAVKKHSRK